jgi:hypothetical protein
LVKNPWQIKKRNRSGGVKKTKNNP